MKLIKIVTLLLISAALTSTSHEYDWRTNYLPVLLSRDDLQKSIEIQSAKDFNQPAKVYLYDQTVFIVEKFEGIHVIDNSNPEDPKKTGFIRIPGCTDVAVKDEVLFSDNAVDLVSIDIASFPEIKELDRFRDVFPEHTPPDLDYIPSKFSSRLRPQNTVITKWEKIE
ncbi:MAG: hypothetical protein ACOCV9_05345 [Marinilabiliaceae bacterium]